MTTDKPFDLEAYCDNLAKADTEHAHQRAFFAWLQKAAQLGMYPDAHMAFAIPNGGQRNTVTASRLKAEGVKPGVPDICYPVPVSQRHGLYIEMKAGDNDTSLAQDVWRANLMRHGYAVCTCWGWRAAVRCFEDYNRGLAMPTQYR